MVLVAHGSRDPRAAAETEALATAVRLASPDTPVRTAYLDHAGPRPGAVLRALQAAGHDRATVVPVLLTAAYHRRVDIPEAVAAARAAGLRIPVRVADVLGPLGGPVDDLLVAAVCRRLAEAAGSAQTDALVLAAAGTRDAGARAEVARVADALAERTGLPCRPAYASAAAPSPAEAVSRLRAEGARRVAVAAYFLAPGRLYAAAVGGARSAGAVAVSEPLGAAEELVRLVLSRAAAAPVG
ncbi:sirohydrochlorin chelatase [Plantactinospora sp. KBS50]|uniref:sirohydrochlorin chelatase n=1 Tax=Plantactinospora sp. KBS50 TaxID=2024580 RepID=UPI000BAAF164|nr:CbiX/SirB N-terminal domain-containing protein [Plantactinospora sp. KBS50]ASW57964.1 cobalamin biosynthesis protein CbiX [Plantactinospora sp. KBS50]